MAKTKMIVQGSEIELFNEKEQDFISLTDMTQNFNGGSVLIEQWLRNKDTILFLGTWEKLNNPDFNSPEFEGIKNSAGASNYYISVKQWIEKTNAIGIKATAGRYGGTYAHKDIAFEFGSWLSPEFKLYLIKEYQRLKLDENNRLSLDWNLNRTLSKLNYKIHTDAIKENLITPNLTKAQTSITYANEADVLNMALFGMTAKQWRDKNPNISGNLRDYASITQLLVLTNLESFNAELINRKITQDKRLKILNEIAVSQTKSLTQNQIQALDKINFLQMKNEDSNGENK